MSKWAEDVLKAALSVGNPLTRCEALEAQLARVTAKCDKLLEACKEAADYDLDKAEILEASTVRLVYRIIRNAIAAAEGEA